MALPRLTIAAVLCGAALLGWAMGGVSSVGDRLAASPQPQLERFVTDHHHGCDGDGDRGHDGEGDHRDRVKL